MNSLTYLTIQIAVHQISTLFDEKLGKVLSYLYWVWGWKYNINILFEKHQCDSYTDYLYGLRVVGYWWIIPFVNIFFWKWKYLIICINLKNNDINAEFQLHFCILIAWKGKVTTWVKLHSPKRIFLSLKICYKSNIIGIGWSS